MVLTLLRWFAQAPPAPRLRASIGITTPALRSRPPSGVERAGPPSGDVGRGTARAPGAGRRCQGPRRDRHPGEVARVAIGAWRVQARCRAACDDWSKHRHCRQTDVTSWSCTRFSVGCPPVGVHPLSFLNDLIRPSTLPNPRSFGPCCRVPRLPAPPLGSGFPSASSRSSGEGILAVFLGV